MFGKGGDDALYGGVLNEAVNDLADTLTAWKSTDDYDTRITAIVSLALNGVLADDGDRDLSLGQAGRDLFFGDDGDRVIGRRGNEPAFF